MTSLLRALCLAFVVLGVLPSCGSTLSRIVPPAQSIPRTFFGLHIHRVTDKTPWPALAVPTWRLWGAQVKWPDLEPSRGRWQFDTLDKYVALAEQHNTEILLPLAVTPQWASARPEVKSGWQKPGLTAEPRETDDWQDYVRQVATRYKGRIFAYEIWNEPNLQQYWIGNTDQLVSYPCLKTILARGVRIFQRPATCWAGNR